jgi:hypothetical protein
MPHVFKKYWDFLSCLNQHPGFHQKSRYAQYCMNLFSQGLSGMDAQGTFELRPSAEAKEEDVLIPERAAVSRLRPIQDGLDYWEEHGRCAVTESGGSAPDSARTMFSPSLEELYTKIFYRPHDGYT